MRKLVACLACRSQGKRLYGKPLQNLDIIESVSILDYMISAIKTYKPVSNIVLAISEGEANLAYQVIAKKHNISWVFGSEEDVLSRLINACKSVDGSDILRLTTESPYTYFEALESAWDDHINNDNDLTALDNLPDGSGFEIIKLEAYSKSWKNGEQKHRSEYCSLYIRENKNAHKIGYVEIPDRLRNTKIRLTVDYPEDLILCRAVYMQFKDLAPRIPLEKILNFLEKNEHLTILVKPYVDEGLKTMYL